jgi:hypothetical protein
VWPERQPEIQLQCHPPIERAQPLTGSPGESQQRVDEHADVLQADARVLDRDPPEPASAGARPVPGLVAVDEHEDLEGHVKRQRIELPCRGADQVQVAGAKSAGEWASRRFGHPGPDAGSHIVGRFKRMERWRGRARAWWHAFGVRRWACPGPAPGGAHRSTEVPMTESTPMIFVADADGSTRTFLAAQLTTDGHEVLSASRAAEVRAGAARGPTALLVLGDFEHLGESLALLREIRGGRWAPRGARPRPAGRRIMLAEGVRVLRALAAEPTRVYTKAAPWVRPARSICTASRRNSAGTRVESWHGGHQAFRCPRNGVHSSEWQRRPRPDDWPRVRADYRWDPVRGRTSSCSGPSRATRRTAPYGGPTS